MVTRSRSSSFLDQDHHPGRDDCVDGIGGGRHEHRRLGRISRSADGRFVLTRDSRSSSLSSSSDDGGFLSHPSFADRMRRPLMTAIAGDDSGGVGGGGSMSMRTCTDDESTTTDSGQQQQQQQRRHRQRRRRPIVATVCGPRTTPYRASSPDGSKPAEWFGPDVSSVLVASSSSSVPPNRSSTATTGTTALRSVHERYSQQLPSLRVIHEENHRTLMMKHQQHHHHQQLQQPNPRYHPNPRFRSRHMRYARSAPELTSDAPANSERSPESRSSSSGFGSKNTTSSLHQHTGGGATADECSWPHPAATSSTRALPPYKPPPPPPPPPLQQQQQQHQQPPTPMPLPTSSLFYANEHWLDLTSPVLPSPSSHSSASKPLSVDDQYEFDPVFPVSPTPTDMMMIATRTPTTPSPSRSRTPTQLKKAKYENVEARLQAMKEEFYAYKRRQAEMSRMGYVESVC